MSHTALIAYPPVRFCRRLQDGSGDGGEAGVPGGTGVGWSGRRQDHEPVRGCSGARGCLGCFQCRSRCAETVRWAGVFGKDRIRDPIPGTRVAMVHTPSPFPVRGWSGADPRVRRCLRPRAWPVTVKPVSAVGVMIAAVLRGMCRASTGMPGPGMLCPGMSWRCKRSGVAAIAPPASWTFSLANGAPV